MIVGKKREREKKSHQFSLNDFFFFCKEIFHKLFQWRTFFLEFKVI